eukprot:CAMPEP_0170752440 /NCGR_PEP_ID=MMETSP0437-20130122/11969_1 /TAXON_ID=0 /ORGANISM="Sexangularia sp." /LENGTH=1509 /DNA_ID=CAMNT_0011091509 /DNA_START=9 /DNA_END=4538 /DNA_ORIENTATION=-
MVDLEEMPGGCGPGDSYCGSYLYHGVQAHGVFEADLNSSKYSILNIDFRFYDSSDSGSTAAWDNFLCELYRSPSDTDPLMDCSAQSGAGWVTKTVPADKLHLFRGLPSPQKIQVTSTVYGGNNGDYFYNPFYSPGYYSDKKWSLYITVHPVCKGCGTVACIEDVPCVCEEGAPGDSCRLQSCSLDSFNEYVTASSCNGVYNDDFGYTAKGSTCEVTFACPPNYNVIGTPGHEITCNECGPSCQATWSENPATLGYCDPDECALGTHNCHSDAVCTDTVGSFTCECKAGFVGDGVTCDVNLCDAPELEEGIGRSCTGPLVAQYGDNTENASCTLVDDCRSLGDYRIVGDLPTITCNAGTLTFDSFDLVYCDEDRCATDTNDCSEYAICDYVVGSFTCTCPDLYHGSGQVCEVEMCPTLTANAGTEVVCEGPLNEEHGDSVALSNCTILNQCPEHHYYLEPAGTADFACLRDESAACATGNDIAACSPSWTSPLEELPYCDPDECLLGTHTCHVDATCENTATGYTCTCIDGHSGDGETCVDIDECAVDELNLCDPDAVCTNLKGTYSCECVREGYTDPEGFGHDCYDVNECEDEDIDDGCLRDSTCVNVDGGRNLCVCNEGYEGDGFTGCVDINECATGANNCSEVGSVCINKAGYHECACVSGYRSVGEVTGEVCVDVDECLAGTASDCSPPAEGGICTNTVGSYFCSCDEGYRLVASWATTCVDINECTDDEYESGCVEHSSCVNVIGSPNRCECNEGFVGDGFVECVDVNECETGDDTCAEEGSTCANTIGGYECTCVEGYADDSGGQGEVCVDVDECANDDTNECSGAADGGVCTNLIGSYECSCIDGFELDGTRCVDINECDVFGRSVLCHETAQCVNTPGSHRCSCLDGKVGNGIQSCIDSTDIVSQVGVLVEVNMAVSCSTFDADTFVTQLALLLAVSPKRVSLLDVRCGSVHARVALLSPQVVAASELRDNDRMPAEELASVATAKLGDEGASSFKEQYQVESVTTSGATVDVPVDKTKQQPYIPPKQEGSEELADSTTSDQSSSSTSVVIIVLVVVIVAGLIAILVVHLRRRSAAAEGASQVEMGDQTYQAPALAQSTRAAGTLAALVSARHDKTLKSSKSGGERQYDDVPRANAMVARAPDAFLRGKVLIPGDELVRDAKIGEGAFGLVYKGQWGDKAVAIKEVKGVSDEAIKQLVDEGERLSQIPPHDNVVTFYGVCAEPMGVVLQFCARGALVDKLYGRDTGKLYDFSLAELQALTIGVAAGLTHLHSCKVIHRDVATRNVLIDEDGAAKLTDFGMSRDQEEGAEYVQQTKTNTGPLKWMAPEQMKERIVSSKADMYSFGLVMWEMYSRSEPWPGVMALQAAGQVMAGKQHAVAKEATPMAAAIMLACLDGDAHARPSAARVVKAAKKVWGADGSKVDGDAVGPDAKENAVVLQLKDRHFAEIPKAEDDAVYLEPPVKSTEEPVASSPALYEDASLAKARVSRKRKSGGGKTPRGKST